MGNRDEELKNTSGFMKTVINVFEYHPKEMFTKMKEDAGLNPFFFPAQTGETYILKRLLNSAKKVGMFFHEVLARKTPAGWNLLHLACANGHTDTFRFLLDMYGKDDSVADECQSSSAAKRRRLLADDILKDTTDEGYNVFHLAAVNGHRETVNALFAAIEQSGTSIRHWLIIKTLKGDNVLQLLASNGGVEILKQITDYCLDKRTHLINMFYDKNHDGNHLLHLASSRGHTNVIKYIINVTKEYDAMTEGKVSSVGELELLEYINIICERNTQMTAKLRASTVFSANRPYLRMKLSEINNDSHNVHHLALAGFHYDTIDFLTDFFTENNMPVPELYDDMNRLESDEDNSTRSEGVENQPEINVEPTTTENSTEN